MTSPEAVDKICEWLNDGICQEIELKKPPTEREPTDINYAYQLINPYAFPLYLPNKEKLPEDVEAQIPSICVQVTEVKDRGRIRTMEISLAVSVWNPGIHPDDWIPETGKTIPTEYQNSADGWRDLWNTMESLTEVIESTDYIDGIAIDKESGVDFGPYKEQNSIPDFSPFWFGYVNFTIKTELHRTNSNYEKYL